MITSEAYFPLSVKDQRVFFFSYRLTCSALSVGFHGLSYNQAARSSTDQGMILIPTLMSEL